MTFNQRLASERANQARDQMRSGYDLGYNNLMLDADRLRSGDELARKELELGRYGIDTKNALDTAAFMAGLVASGGGGNANNMSHLDRWTDMRTDEFKNLDKEIQRKIMLDNAQLIQDEINKALSEAEELNTLSPVSNPNVAKETKTKTNVTEPTTRKRKYNPRTGTWV